MTSRMELADNMFILSLAFIAIAAMCNSVMDKTDHHFEKSIFNKITKYREWWYTPDSWKNKYIDRDSKKGRKKWPLNINKPVQITDAWHFFKTLMIISICLSIVFYEPMFNKYIDIIIYGTLWNLSFSFLYNFILNSRN